MGGKHFEKKKTNIVKNLFLIIFVLIFVFSSIMVIIWLIGNYGLSKIENELIDKVVTINSGEDNDNEGQDNENKGSISVDFNSLKEINSDIVAWIYIKDTDINYPILQTGDNNYYLRRDIYKKYSFCGSIFMDYNNSSDFSDDNTIIYGHNLKNKKMFADLSKIYNGTLGNKVEIEIYTENAFHKYQVITSYMEEPNNEIIQRSFTEEEKNTYITKNISKSKTKFEYSADISNKMLTLVTCDSTGKKRIVVTAHEIM